MKILSLFCLFSLMIVSWPTFARESPGHLRNQLDISREDTSTLTIINHLLFHYMYANPDSAYYFGKIGIEMAQKLQANDPRGHMHLRLGNANWQQGKYQQAKEEYTEAKEAFQLAGNIVQVAYATRKTGDVLVRVGDYEAGLKAMFDALAIFQDQKEYDQIGNTYNSIGLTYNNYAEYERAKSYYVKALKTPGFTEYEGIHYTYNNMATSYHYLDQKDSSRYYLDLATEARKKLGLAHLVAQSYYTFAELIREEGRFLEAETYYKRAIHLLDSLNQSAGLPFIHNSLGMTYQAQGQYEKALPHFKTALEMGRKAGQKNMIKYALYLISECYKDMKDYKEALGYFHEFVNMKDSILSTETRAKMAELETKYESIRKEKELQAALEENARVEVELLQKESMIYLLILAVVVNSIGLMRSWRKGT